MGERFGFRETWRFTLQLLLVATTTDAFASPKISAARAPFGLVPSHPRCLKLSGTAAISSNEDLLPGIEAIDSMNPKLLENLGNLRLKPYFRLFSVDMLASCEYIPQELFECYSETCEVYPVDDELVPSRIKEVDGEEHGFDLDGWARWDMPSEDYYDTEDFPESYTGYDGAEVWNFIHDRICFDSYGYNDNHWKADFNKAVSGLHSMVSGQIILGIQEKLDAGEDFRDEEVWRDPAKEFQRRLSPSGETPLALENLYFCYMLLLTAAYQAKDRLLADCASGSIDELASDDLMGFLSHPLLQDPAVAAASKKLHDDALEGSGLWEARLRTRELYRIMNCVQCNKCRLHGKISVMGLSTALQILVGRNGKGGDISPLHRVELATLMSALYKFSRVIEMCNSMKE